MPSQYFNGIGDDDLGAIIAYLKSLSPIDNEVPATSLGPLGRIITLLDSALLPASEVDHTAARKPVPERGVTAAYGGYLAIICTACHGDTFSGGSVPGEGPDAPMGRNLTQGGALVSWSDADFANLLRTGRTPAGEQLDEEFMPWDSFKHLTDDEIRALWLFISALPAREFGE